MADSANTLYRDAVLRHQIYLLRLSGGLTNRIIALLDETEADMAGVILGSLFSARSRTTRLMRADRLARDLRKIRSPAWDEIRKLLTTEMHDLMKQEAVFHRGAIATTMPVIVDVTLPAPATLRALVSELPFEGRLLKKWVADLRASDLQRIQDQIKIGIVQGESMQDILRRVRGTKVRRGSDGVTQISRHHVRSITRSAVMHFTNAARTQTYLQNGRLFAREVYAATLDSRTTKICASLDGNTYNVGEGPQPPIHFNCRSTRAGVVNNQVIGQRPAKRSTERELVGEYAQANRLAGVRSRDQLPFGHKTKYDNFARRRIRQLTGRVPAETTYREWFRTQSAAFQDDVLGPTRGKLYRRGGLDIDRFVDRDGQDLTLAQLARRDAEAFRAAGLNPENFN